MKSSKHEPAASKMYSSDISQGFGVVQEGTWGFPGGSNGKESACSAGGMGLILGLGRSPGEGNTPVFLPGKFHGQRSPVGYSPCGLRVRHN